MSVRPTNLPPVQEMPPPGGYRPVSRFRRKILILCSDAPAAPFPHDLFSSSYVCIIILERKLISYIFHLYFFEIID